METPLLLGIADVAVACLACAVVLVRNYRRVKPGEALVIETRASAPLRVSFGGALVLPVLNRAEVLDLSVRKVVVERRGKQGLSCQDGIRVDVRATFQVKVARVEQDVLRVAREVGCARANRPEEVQALLEERLACGLANAASTFNFDELVADRSLFIDHVMMEIGNDLLGFKLERMSLGRLEQTPLDQLDPTNELDAPGVLKLTQRASRPSIEAVGQMPRSRWTEQREQDDLPWGGEETPRKEAEPRGREELARDVEEAFSEQTRKNGS